MRIFTIIIAVLLFLGCGSKEREQKSVEEKPYRLDVREWGVMFTEGEKRFSELVNSPDESSTMNKPSIKPAKVREPVIYFNAEGIDSLHVSVAITGGKPTVTYPYAKIVDSTASWSLSFPDSMKDMVYDSSLSSCLKKTVNLLNYVKASPLEVNGTKARSLFYEGLMEYGNRLNIISQEGGRVAVQNDNEYTLYDVWFFSRNGSSVESFFADSLSSGGGFLGKVESASIVSSKMSKEFPQDEIESFKKFWTAVSFESYKYSYKKSKQCFAVAPPTPEWTTYRIDTRLFYRLPETVVDSLLPLTFSKKPTSISRVLHVLAFPNVNKDPVLTYKPSVDAINSGVVGKRSRAQVMRVVRKNMSSVNKLYLKRCETISGLHGRITVKWSIDENGRVIFCRIVSSTMYDSVLEQEIVKLVNSYQFGKSKTPGDVTEVVFPFVFRQ